jgi:two-component system sensor histidine kinase KdpD
MLNGDCRRQERGQDVVVGAVQPKRPADVEALLERLEVIPLKPNEGAGVLDVEAILRRKPVVCIVDGVAYDNPPGSRHPKRWQDVEELVSNGITVITSLNVQHIEEEQEKVERITGKRAAQAVPKRFLGLADEIVVVDVPSEMLLARTGGTTGEPGESRRLSELREMTLLLTAEVVDRQLEDDQAWGAHERIMVCLTPRANVPRMLASGKRNADRFHGDLVVVYVEQPGMGPEDKAIMDRAFEHACELGAETRVLEGDEPIEAILRFARANRITQIFVGHTLRQGWWRRFTGGPLDRLIQAAEDMDVRVFPH